MIKPYRPRENQNIWYFVETSNKNWVRLVLLAEIRMRTFSVGQQTSVTLWPLSSPRHFHSFNRNTLFLGDREWICRKIRPHRSRGKSTEALSFFRNPRFIEQRRGMNMKHESFLPVPHFIKSSRGSLYIRSVCVCVPVNVGHDWQRSESSDEPSVRLSGTNCLLLCLKNPKIKQRTVLLSKVKTHLHLPFSFSV